MKQYAFFAYHQKDNNILETCLNSLHAVCPSVSQVVVTDGIPQDIEAYTTTHFKTRWIHVSPSMMNRRRAACKIEALNTFIQSLAVEDQVLVSDVDVYYQGDPFKAFDEFPALDLGLTTRGYPYMFPINGGIFFVRVNAFMKCWADWYRREFIQPRWEPYITLRQRYNHFRYGLDWGAQDFLIACWLFRDAVYNEHNVNVVDVGPRYNYCPATDTMKSEAFARVRAAVNNPQYPVLHLKSDLKRLVYEAKLFPNALIRHPRGNLSWL